jgi:hypothetical protein
MKINTWWWFVVKYFKNFKSSFCFLFVIKVLKTLFAAENGIKFQDSLAWILLLAREYINFQHIVVVAEIQTCKFLPINH